MAYYISTHLPKICHAHVGQPLRLTDPKTGEILPEVFMVVAVADAKRRPARKNMTQGLYDEERELFLISLSTGIARRIPHLSNRAELLKKDDLNGMFDIGSAPVLVSAQEDAQHEVTLSTVGSGIRKVNLSFADPVAVKTLLIDVMTNNSYVVSVASQREVQQQYAKRAWQAAVAQDATDLSFDDYRKANNF